MIPWLRDVAAFVAAVLAVCGASLLLGAHCEQPRPSSVPTCGDVCGHLLDLGCGFAQPTPLGEPCESTCRDARYWDRRCLAEVGSCQAAAVCAAR
jgi:hypothetical protein